MTTLDKLHAIERMALVHAVLYVDGQVAFEFYEPGRIIPEEIVEAERRAGSNPHGEGSWRKNLVVYRAYPSFEAAVDAEHDRLLATPDAGWRLIHTNGWDA